jgi:hypothetical protein
MLQFVRVGRDKSSCVFGCGRPDVYEIIKRDHLIEGHMPRDLLKRMKVAIREIRGQRISGSKRGMKAPEVHAVSANKVLVVERSEIAVQPTWW